MKYFTSFIIGALIMAVAFLAYLQFSFKPTNSNSQTTGQENTAQVQQSDTTMPNNAATSQATDLIQAVKDSSNAFTYIATADKIGGSWKILIKSPDTGTFSFNYSGQEGNNWGAMRYLYSDLTASDSGAPLSGFSHIGIYSFCAANYDCDERTRTGMGFQLDFWNAKYNNPSDPGYYPNSGETIVLKTDKFVIGYQPYAPVGCAGQNAQQNYCTDQQKQITSAVDTLFKSFKFN